MHDKLVGMVKEFHTDNVFFVTISNLFMNRSG